MMLCAAAYNDAGIDPTKPMLQMPDFNSLIAKSQEHQVPIYQLTPAQLEQAGTVLSVTQWSHQDFERLFSEAADKVIKIIDADIA